MIGTAATQANAGAAANVGSLVGGSANLQAQFSADGTDNSSVSKAPIALAVIIAAYLVWAIAVQHQRIQAQLSPANVAVNVHNIIVVGFTALLFLVVGKLATTKAVIIGLPGAGWVAQLFAAA